MAVDDTLARLPGAFSCNLETQPLTGLAGLLASQMSFSQCHRCLSCKVQMDQPSTSRGEPATKVETEADITGHSCFVLTFLRIHKYIKKKNYLNLI